MGTTPNRLKRLREFYGMSAIQLGELMSVTRATIYNWEAPSMGSPIPDWAKEALANTFGVSIAHLMGWEDGEEAADE